MPRSKYVAIRFDQDERNAVNRVAERHGLNNSDLMRSLVLDGVRQIEATGELPAPPVEVRRKRLRRNEQSDRSAPIGAK